MGGFPASSAYWEPKLGAWLRGRKEAGAWGRGRNWGCRSSPALPGRTWPRVSGAASASVLPPQGRRGVEGDPRLPRAGPGLQAPLCLKAPLQLGRGTEQGVRVGGSLVPHLTSEGIDAQASHRTHGTGSSTSPPPPTEPHPERAKNKAGGSGFTLDHLGVGLGARRHSPPPPSAPNLRAGPQGSTRSRTIYPFPS